MTDPHFDPHAIPFTLDHVKASVTPRLVEVELSECDITIYRHDPKDGSPAYLVIDIDNELDADHEPLELRIYRNDAPVYIETNTQEAPQ